MSNKVNIADLLALGRDASPQLAGAMLTALLAGILPGSTKIMNMEKIVYHGSHQEFDSEKARPKRNVRTQPDESGEVKVVFDQESFHATPHKWIALAYTCRRAPYEIDGKKTRYSMGVDLDGNDQTVRILGFESLEKSLEQMYGEGGYVYHFGPDKFLYKEGLGSREVIAEEP
jgi:hypothetical protein